MKWFKHMTDSRHDAFIRQLEIEWKAIYKSAAEGVGLWWRLIELIAEMMDDEKGPFIIVNKKYLFQEMYMIREQKWNRFRIVCERFGKIKVQDCGNDIRIECNNIKKIKDEWTSRKEKMRENTRELLGSDSVSPINRVLYKDKKTDNSIESIKDNKLSKAPETSKNERVHLPISSLGFTGDTLIEPVFSRDQYDPRYQQCVKDAQAVVGHFNLVTGKNAGCRGVGYKRIVTLLWNGLTVDELNAVVDTKNQDPNFSQWMTTKTLFGDKFFDYQQENVKDYQQPKDKAQQQTFNVGDEEYADIIQFDGGCKVRQPDGTFKIIMDGDDE